MSFSQLHTKGAGALRSTLMPKKTEAIHHNCDNGHVWFALMYPVPHKQEWVYVNRKQRWCPDCGQMQCDEEPII